MHKQSCFIALALLFVSCNSHLAGTEAIKKNGLLIMLHDYRQRIEYFEKKGMAERAETERSTIAAQNRAAVQLFKQEFDFCPVHFFYSSQSKDLAAGKRVLLNDQLQPDSSLPLPPIMIIADYGIGNVEENTTKLESFRIDTFNISIRPTFKTRYSKSGQLEARDVERFNRVLKKKNAQ